MFRAEFKFNPRGQTSDYFLPLYADLAKANGFWSYSIVDVTDAVIMTIHVDARRRLSVDYEDYAPATGQ